MLQYKQANAFATAMLVDWSKKTTEYRIKWNEGLHQQQGKIQ